jgi:hypothetical protein
LRNFYAGIAPGIAINNCGIEGTNGTVKEWVGRNASASAFFQKVGSFMNFHSSKRNPLNVNSPIIWQTEPTISQSTWVSANFMYNQNKKEYTESDYQIVTFDDVHYMVVHRKDNPQYYCGEEQHRQSYVRNRIDAYLRNSWTSMAEYHHFVNFENLVIRKDNNWTCHCPLATREFVCDHVLCVKLFLKMITVPRTAMSFNTQKRGVGRAPTSNKYTKCDDVLSPPATPLPVVPVVCPTSPVAPLGAMGGQEEDDEEGIYVLYTGTLYFIPLICTLYR